MINQTEALGFMEQLTPDELNKLLLSGVDANSLTLVKFAISLGADVTVCYNLPLTRACNNGNIDVANLLIANGAELPTDRTSLLTTAYLNGYPKIVDLLLGPATNPLG